MEKAFKLSELTSVISKCLYLFQIAQLSQKNSPEFSDGDMFDSAWVLQQICFKNKVA